MFSVWKSAMKDKPGWRVRPVVKDKPGWRIRPVVKDGTITFIYLLYIEPYHVLFNYCSAHALAFLNYFVHLFFSILIITMRCSRYFLFMFQSIKGTFRAGHDLCQDLNVFVRLLLPRQFH